MRASVDLTNSLEDGSDSVADCLRAAEAAMQP
jgi:hypothetical protein